MNYELLELEYEDHLAILTLNRPELLNALNAELVSEFHTAIDEIGDNQNVRTLIITGQGRGFCSGADVTRWPEARSQDNQTATTASVGRGIVELAPHLRSIPQPVIAAVNGIAAGAGLGVALAADFRIASQHARFSAIFVRRSLVPDTGTSYTLAQLVGHGVASEMALAGRIYDAPWALQKGLVNSIVPAQDLLTTAKDIANDIANNPPITVRAIKRLIDSWDENLNDVIIRETLGNSDSSSSEDRKEAVRAFMENRIPTFHDR